MTDRGKLIALEGIDGSGKHTQMRLLVRALEARGIAYAHMSFPRYRGFFGRLIAQFLNGEFGPLGAVDPHFSALLFAGDRLEVKPGMENELTRGRIVLADRYVGSNLAHQGARVPREKREDFLCWLRSLEYEIYGLPREDLAIYLRLPVAESQRLVEQKGRREYTRLRRDLQEADRAHLEAASQTYDWLARGPNWVTIESWDPAAHVLRPPEAIQQDVMAAVESRVLPSISAPKR